MMRTLAQTGNGWMTFKDAVQPRVQPDRAAAATSCTCRTCAPRSSRSPSDDETAVCNLGSINLGAHYVDADGAVRLREARARPCARRCRSARPGDRHQLLPDRRGRARRTRAGARSASALMGLQDVFFQLRLPFDCAEARDAVARGSPRRSTSTRSSASCELAARARRAPGVRRDPRGRAASCSSTPGASTPDRHRRAGTRCASAIAEHGLRNSLLIAIAPTATIASIAGCYECIEPQVSNLFKRETLSGEFLQVNRYLVARAARRSACGRETMRDAIKLRRGLGAGHRRAARRRCARCTARRGSCRMRSLIDMAADRGAVHRPEPVAEPVHGEPDHRQAVVDVPATPGSRA